MTTSEFSTQFDVLYNNIASNQAQGITEYEKSVFLTKAQDEILKNRFIGAFRGQQQPSQGYDQNYKRPVDFSSLTTEDTSNPTSGGMNTGNYQVTLPSNIMFIINETVQHSTIGQLSVTPIVFEDYIRLMSKPFKRPPKYQCWRFVAGTTITDQQQNHIKCELRAMAGTLSNYKVRYIKFPQPIILTSLSDDGLSIHGIQGVTECELDPILHEEILQRAVEIAKIAYSGEGAQGAQEAQLQVQAGQIHSE